MRNTLCLSILAVCLASAPAMGADRKPAEGQKRNTSAAHPATHAVRGVVKSVDHSTLVVTRTRRKASDLTFALNSSTIREGAIAVGATVSVRYYVESHTLVATAVGARRPPDSSPQPP